ncbi:MAG: hypothetical protein KAG61_06875 [Bacteriovoracaceae bacterium]|nr:hypothetical protein [Bacteriovoracaceae bacterium]
MKALIVTPILFLILTTSGYGEESEHSINYVAPTAAAGVDAEALTDQQKVMSDNYVHDGLSVRKKTELCEGNEDACNGETASLLGQTGDQLVGALSKAYAMVLGTSSGKVVMGPKTDAKPLEGAKTAENREVSDYCKYIAVAGEAVGTIKQQMDQKNLENIPVNADTAQKELLYKAARSHGARAETAKIQAYAWGGTSTCYVGMIAYSAYTGGVTSAGTTAKDLGLKLGASVVLTGFFGALIGKHEGYEKKVDDIASQMPGEGDCNPITDLNCYCTQPETEYDPQYCTPGLHDKELQTGDVRITCIDQAMKSDPKCICEESGSCLDKKYITDLSSLGLGSNFVSTNSETMRGITTGKVLAGDVAEAQINRNIAAGKNALKKVTKSMKPIRLNADQQKQADVFEKFGLAKNVASRLAAMPVTPEMKQAESKIRALAAGAEKGKKITKKKRSNLMYFGGSGAAKKKSTKKKRFNPFAKLNKKKNNNKNTSDIMRFAKQAEADAQITKDKGRSIFEIISRRYQVSGQRRLFGE